MLKFQIFLIFVISIQFLTTRADGFVIEVDKERLRKFINVGCYGCCYCCCCLSDFNCCCGCYCCCFRLCHCCWSCFCCGYVNTVASVVAVVSDFDAVAIVLVVTDVSVAAIIAVASVVAIYIFTYFLRSTVWVTC